MKNTRTAVYLLLTTALACVGARTARADGLEGVHESAGAIFDNNGANASTADNGAPTITPGSGAGPAVPMTPPQAAPKSGGVPLPPIIKETTKTFKENWKALAAGAAIGGFIGAAMGSTIPGAGTILGGVIGATMGMGLALLFSDNNGKDSVQDVGKTLTGAGAGALVGAALGSTVPIIGTVLGAVAGALIGGFLTHEWF